jgi:hypothetical protein
LNAGGDRTDEQVSDPVPTVARLAATAAADPPLDPEGRRPRSYAFRVAPPSELTVSTPNDSSCRFAFARITAPASRSRSTTNASHGGRESASATDPAVVGMSWVS